MAFSLCYVIYVCLFVFVFNQKETKSLLSLKKLEIECSSVRMRVISMDDSTSLVSVRGTHSSRAPERRALWLRSPMACSRD